MLIVNLIRDRHQQQRLLNSLKTIPVIAAKAAWALKWIDATDALFATRLVAFAAVEGIFFSSSFASIFWLKKRGLMPGLCHSNELISRDEGLHTEFACELFNMLSEKPSADTIHMMIREAVELEKQFFSGR